MKLEIWERNLYAVWVGQFLALMGASLVFPFIPFFIGDLGVEGADEGALDGALLRRHRRHAVHLVAVLGLPRRPVRPQEHAAACYAGAMVTITLQALVQTVWQLVALRALQGLFVGTIAATA